ncbi:thioredoxin domain-containing protein [Aquihabitans sp. G128]|uniref:thioredoxin domain-containing protein n=1 Tax=Aquihabitans sp. G128 TaxID=2849779 RepID=UPI001C239BB2|nr:thioredoxin domain-containing protein [Aquihabitans sp. G128]QXC61671.1 thioredoxin domain-containing protein [Aquihabitans sp. G128]
MNRLASELSPYLRQHAENPVDWHPWGEEAFATARATDRPLLVSIGYSACHWCHVMAHESFEDPDTAAVLNELFVCIKVDREERPDVDAVYMDAVQAMTGAGGWPLTAFTTPDGKPFFTGTYFPPEAAPGRPSFLQVCRAVHEAWTERREQLLEQADQITAHLEQAAPPGEGGGVDAGLLQHARDQLVAQHDPRHGGFGSAPKFPQTMAVELLLRRHQRSGGDAEALAAAVGALDAMAAGGIHDHLGGGFARYSVDERWLVPHFEKMLYDQALLARAYLHAWQVTGDDRHRRVLDDTVGYVLRDLRHTGGGFHAAEDADSEGVEGRYYVWTPEQVHDVLGIDTQPVLAWWGVTEGGNFEGATILNRLHGDPAEPEPALVTDARRRLLEAREERVRPGLDDKVLTEWNALMLATLAEAGAATGNRLWIDAAVANAEFLLTHLRTPEGRWLRSWQDDGAEGRARHLALAVDHAALLDAFVRLAEATGQARWIQAAGAVADDLLALFWDPEHGGLFTTGDDAERLVVRAKDLLDNATPSANSLAAVALLRLAALTGDERYRAKGTEIVALLAPLAAKAPTALAHLLGAVDLLVGGIQEVAVVGDAPALVLAVQTRYLPGSVLAWGEPYPSPLWEQRQAGLGYVCEQFTCREPVSTPEALVAQLR